MGLDMYLNKQTYIGNHHKVKADMVDIKMEGVKKERLSTITEQVGYWRKANAIHGWIVENVQDGKDECQESYFTEEEMKELLGVVNKVLKASKLVKAKVVNGYTMKGSEKIENPAVAKELLPVTSGFFFGDSNEDTAYDEWYYEQLVETKKIMEECLKEGGDYYYHSSW